MRRKLKIIRNSIWFILLSGLFLYSCDTVSDEGNQSEVKLQFGTTIESGNSFNSPAVMSANSSQLNGDTLRIEGDNGTLVITDIQFIVEDFEAEKSDGDCGDLPVEPVEDDCNEFESEPILVDLPLNGEVVDISSSAIDPGFYEAFEFDVDDLDLDEENDEEDEQSKQELINQVRSVFPDWPESVSMVIIGEFINAQDDTTAFKVFAEAEIEIELEFDPPLEISDNEQVNKLIIVRIDPTQWLKLSDNMVVDLREFDFESTGRILEFEAEFENGFESIEVDDLDDNS